MDLRSKFVASIIVPYGIKDSHLVAAINKAIREVAAANEVDLGRSIDWEVKVWWDHTWRGEEDTSDQQSRAFRTERLNRNAEGDK